MQSFSANLFPISVAESAAVLITGTTCVGGNVQKADPEHFQYDSFMGERMMQWLGYKPDM